MDVYNLINSNAISNHCRKIQHKFNTEEVAILIYRNKQMSIEEKINAYNELINEYDDMSMIEHLHYKAFDSVKSVIKDEINRLNDLCTKFIIADTNYFFTANVYYISSERMEYNHIDNVKETYKEVLEQLTAEIEEYNDISSFKIIKKAFDSKYNIMAEYIVQDKHMKMINIYEYGNDYPVLESIFLNLPTPFKKGDLLYSKVDATFYKGYTNRSNNIFCLDWMINWEDNLKERLEKGNYDDSDMIGSGYYIANGNIIAMPMIIGNILMVI